MHTRAERRVFDRKAKRKVVRYFLTLHRARMWGQETVDRYLDPVKIGSFASVHLACGESLNLIHRRDNNVKRPRKVGRIYDLSD